MAVRKKKDNKSGVIFLFLIVVLACGGYYFYQQYQLKQDIEKEEEEIKTEEEEIERETTKTIIQLQEDEKKIESSFFFSFLSILKKILIYLLLIVIILLVVYMFLHLVAILKRKISFMFVPSKGNFADYFFGKKFADFRKNHNNYDIDYYFKNLKDYINGFKNKEGEFLKKEDVFIEFGKELGKIVDVRINNLSQEKIFSLKEKKLTFFSYSFDYQNQNGERKLQEKNFSLSQSDNLMKYEKFKDLKVLDIEKIANEDYDYRSFLNGLFDNASEEYPEIKILNENNFYSLMIQEIRKYFADCKGFEEFFTSFIRIIFLGIFNDNKTLIGVRYLNFQNEIQQAKEEYFLNNKSFFAQTQEGEEVVENDDSMQSILQRNTAQGRIEKIETENNLKEMINYNFFVFLTENKRKVCLPNTIFLKNLISFYNYFQEYLNKWKETELFELDYFFGLLLQFIFSNYEIYNGFFKEFIVSNKNSQLFYNLEDGTTKMDLDKDGIENIDNQNIEEMNIINNNTDYKEQ